MHDYIDTNLTSYFNILTLLIYTIECIIGFNLQRISYFGLLSAGLTIFKLLFVVIMYWSLQSLMTSSISGFISGFISAFQNLSKQITIKTIRQFNFVTTTSYVNNLCVVLLFPIVVLKMAKKLVKTYT